jgi:hypothetical protein
MTMALQAGLKKAEPLPKSLTISVPASRVRRASLSICSLVAISVKGTPPTVVRRGRGTMSGPCPPRTVPATSATDTPSSMATKARQRAVSRVPAMPTT